MVTLLARFQFFILRTYLPLLTYVPLYGSIEINTLAPHYGESKEIDDGMELEPVLDGQEPKEQMMAKNFINTRRLFS